MDAQSRCRYSPETYVSRDPNAVARHIDQANGAGIDSFVVSWFRPGNPTDERFRMMLDIAGGKGFSATIDFEANKYGSRKALITALNYVRDQLMPHGAFARVNGKPILFFWRYRFAEHFQMGNSKFKTFSPSAARQDLCGVGGE